jgi:hypothetical protein
MSIQEVSAEQFAELFHHYHQALGPELGSEVDSKHDSWAEVPQQDRSRMVAAARLALLELGSAETRIQDLKRYFAKPGEAEWGC